MNNKLYTAVKQFIKENYKFMLLFFLAFLLIVVKLPWSIYAPGGTINVNKRLTNVPYATSGSFNLTYVSFLEGTLPTLLVASILPAWDIVPNTDIVIEGEDIKDANRRDELYLKQSISNAFSVAYNKAGIPLTIQDTHNYVMAIVSEAKTTLRIGDELLSYDGIPYNDVEEMHQYLATKELGENLTLEVLRDKKTMEVSAEVISYEGEKKLGVSLANIKDYQNDNLIDYETKASESGPSGGLILSLAIYNSLVEKDYTNGRKICGTGTIEEDGTVGEIGGIKYKILGAYNSKCDVFIVPEANYEEAKQVAEDIKYQTPLIKALNFDQVIAELEKIA